jgi:regulator of replication initiation timing
MATKTAPTTTAVEPIDRLEEKIKLLVSVIGRLRNEQTRLMEDNGRLQREIESMRARVAEAEGTAGELADLRGERDQIRTRVTEMLQQLDALNL